VQQPWRLSGQERANLLAQGSGLVVVTIDGEVLEEGLVELTA
jgi:hypothetical protein